MYGAGESRELTAPEESVGKCTDNCVTMPYMFKKDLMNKAHTGKHGIIEINDPKE